MICNETLDRRIVDLASRVHKGERVELWCRHDGKYEVVLMTRTDVPPHRLWQVGRSTTEENHIEGITVAMRWAGEMP